MQMKYQLLRPMFSACRITILLLKIIDHFLGIGSCEFWKCRLYCRKESDTAKQLNWLIVNYDSGPSMAHTL